MSRKPGRGGRGGRRRIRNWLRRARLHRARSRICETHRRSNRDSSCTQSPYMDPRYAKLLGIPPKPCGSFTAVGGGFGTKLDLSVQPFLAVGCMAFAAAGRMVYSRIESIMCTQAPPARMRCAPGPAKTESFWRLISPLISIPAYSSWAPRLQLEFRCTLRTLCRPALSRPDAGGSHNIVPAGAFRGFGVPQMESRRSNSMRSCHSARNRPTGISHPECARQSHSHSHGAGDG